MSLLTFIQGAIESLTKPSRKATLPRAERFETQGFSCHLGELKDMSSSGMKVACKGQPTIKVNDQLPLRLASPFQQVQVTARVAWIRRNASGYSVGFEFVNLVPGMKDALASLARYGFAELDQPGPRRGRSQREDGEKNVKPVLSASVDYEDLYAMLGLTAQASQDEIHASYRRLAQKFHPDVNGSPEAAVRFADLSKAYGVLNDPEKRKQYDDLVLRSRMVA